MSAFSDTLRRLREQVGYTSARAFFKGRGGQVHFGCTYRQYLNVETGRSAPGPRLMEKIAVGLRLMEDKDRAREFFTAYLHSVHRSEDLVHLIITTYSEPTSPMDGAQPAMMRAMARQTDQRAIILTREQSAFITECKENYWGHALLANDDGHWAVQDLAAAVGIAPAVFKKSLEKLVKLGVIQKDADGKYFNPNAGAFYRHPQDDIYLKTGMPRLQGLWSDMAAEKGESLLNNSLMTRASEADIRQFLPYIIQCLKACDVCTTVKKGKDTAFFQVEARVRKILPF